MGDVSTNFAFQESRLIQAMTECPSCRGQAAPGGSWWSTAARAGRGWTENATSGTQGSSPGARRSWTASAKTPSTTPTPVSGEYVLCLIRVDY